MNEDTAPSAFRARAPRTLKLQKPAPLRKATPNDETSTLMREIRGGKIQISRSTLSTKILEEEYEEKNERNVCAVSAEERGNLGGNEGSVTDWNENLINDNVKKNRRAVKLTKPRPLQRNSLSMPEMARSESLDKDDIEKQTIAFIDKLSQRNISLAEIVAFRHLLMENNIVLRNVGYDTFSLCCCVIQEAVKLEKNPKKKELLSGLLSYTGQKESVLDRLGLRQSRSRSNSVNEEWNFLHDDEREDINNNDIDFCMPCDRQRQVRIVRRLSNSSAEEILDVALAETRRDMNQNFVDSRTSIHTASRKVDFGQNNMLTVSVGSNRTCDKNQNYADTKTTEHALVRKRVEEGIKYLIDENYTTSKDGDDELHITSQKFGDERIVSLAKESEKDQNENLVVTRPRRLSGTLFDIIQQRDIHMNDVIVDPRDSAKKSREAHCQKAGQFTDAEKIVKVSVERQKSVERELDTKSVKRNLISVYATQESRDSGIGDDDVLWDTEESVQQDWRESVEAGTIPEQEEKGTISEHEEKGTVSKHEEKGTISEHEERGDGDSTLIVSEEESKCDSEKSMEVDSPSTLNHSNSWATWKQEPSPVKQGSGDNGAWTSWRKRSDSFDSHDSVETTLNTSRRGSYDGSDSLVDLSKSGAKNSVMKSLLNNLNRTKAEGNKASSILKVSKFGTELSVPVLRNSKDSEKVEKENSRDPNIMSDLGIAESKRTTGAEHVINASKNLLNKDLMANTDVEGKGERPESANDRRDEKLSRLDVSQSLSGSLKDRPSQVPGMSGGFGKPSSESRPENNGLQPPSDSARERMVKANGENFSRPRNGFGKPTPVKDDSKQVSNEVASDRRAAVNSSETHGGFGKPRDESSDVNGTRRPLKCGYLIKDRMVANINSSNMSKPSSGFGNPPKANPTKAEPVWKGLSSEGVSNWRDSCPVKPKFLTRETEQKNLKHALIRQPLGPGSSTSVVSEVESALPQGIFTPGWRRRMFRKFQQAVPPEEEEDEVLRQFDYSRSELLQLSQTPLAKLMPREFSYLSKVYPDICFTEPQYENIGNGFVKA